MKENSIEEDMKIIEQIKDIFLYLKFHGWINDIKQDIDTDKAIRTLEHILSDYKRVLKENEELKSKNKTLEELLQGNLYELYKYYKELAGSYQGNCIPKQKIKDILNKIEKRNYNNYTNEQNGNEIKNKILFDIQELLEKE